MQTVSHYKAKSFLTSWTKIIPFPGSSIFKPCLTEFTILSLFFFRDYYNYFFFRLNIHIKNLAGFMDAGLNCPACRPAFVASSITLSPFPVNNHSYNIIHWIIHILPLHGSAVVTVC